MGFETIEFAKENGVAQVVLNRPRVLNAFNIQMRDDIWEALLAVRDDPDIRSVVLRSASDRAFCAGADLTEFGSAPSQAIARQVRRERGVWELWAGIPKPFVCALNGYVLGSGVEMAMLCDIRVAAEDAVFGLPEVALGMVPAAGGTQTVPRAAGLPPAVEMVLANRRASAGEALRLGMVHRVVPRDRLLPEAAETARQLADLDPAAAQAAKRAVREGTELSIADALSLEERLALGVAMAGYGRP